MSGQQGGAPPGKNAGAPTQDPGNVERPPSGSDALRVTDLTSEPVFVVHIRHEMVSWRRVFITEDSAWHYADRMHRLGDEVEVETAVLVSRRTDGGVR